MQFNFFTLSDADNLQMWNGREGLGCFYHVNINVIVGNLHGKVGSGLCQLIILCSQTSLLLDLGTQN